MTPSNPITTSNPTAPSNTTQRLIEMLLERDAVGQRKYSHTLDRSDLLCEDWAQHAIEESLDRAGYLLRMVDTAAALRAENTRLAEENLRLRSAILPLAEFAKALGIEPTPQAQAVVVEAPVLVEAPVFNILTEAPAPLPSISEPMPTVVATIAKLPFAQITTAETVPAGCIGAVEAGGGCVWLNHHVCNDPESPPVVVAAPAPSTLTTTTAPLPDGCIGAVEAAERMGVARNTISGWVSRGYLHWAGSYRTPSGVMGKYVRIAELDAVPAMLERVEEERRRKSGSALRQVPTEVRAQQIRDSVAAKRDQERPAGGVSYAEAGKFLGISPDSVRLYAKRGLLERIGETPYVTRASVMARKESLSVSAASVAFDNNEEGKLTQIDQGKSTYRNIKLFYLSRRTTDSGYLWDSQPNRSCDPGWEVVEEWRCNGLGRWESTPEIPGMVGTGNGVTKGTRGYTVPVLG